MSIEFNCPNCQKAYKVADTNAGKRFACKECGQPVEVPSAGAGAPADEGYEQQAAAPQRGALPRPKLPGGRGPGGPRPPGGPRAPGGPRPGAPRPMGGPGGNAPYGQQGYGPPVKPHRATVILVLGILSWVVCGLVGIAGLVMGGSDLKEMRSGVMDRTGEGTTKAGYYLSMVAVIMMVIGLIAVVIMFAMFGTVSHSTPQQQRYGQPPRYGTVLP